MFRGDKYDYTYNSAGVEQGGQKRSAVRLYWICAFQRAMY